MKWIADITFHFLGISYVIAEVLTKINGFLNTVILLIITGYFAIRSYLKLKREHVALKKEMFEQMLREKEYYKNDK